MWCGVTDFPGLLLGHFAEKKAPLLFFCVLARGPFSPPSVSAPTEALSKSLTPHYVQSRRVA
jgi:hypothetical protein